MLHAGHEKTAAPLSQEMLKILGTGAAHSGAHLLAGLGVTAIGAGGRALYEKATKKRDLDRILAVYPHLNDFPRADIELAYNSMRTMNPTMAKDPLTGGTLLAQILRTRDPLNPKGSPRFEHDLAGNLMRLNPKAEHVFEETARDAVMQGITSALREHGQNATSTRQELFQTDMEGKRRAFEALKEKNRVQENADERAHEVDQTTRDRIFRASQAREDRAAKLKNSIATERYKTWQQQGNASEQHGWKREDDEKGRHWDVEKALFAARLRSGGVPDPALAQEAVWNINDLYKQHPPKHP